MIKEKPHSKLDRNKYESMLQEVINQLSLTIDRKHEDIDQLNMLREKALVSIDSPSIWGSSGKQALSASFTRTDKASPQGDRKK